MSDEREPVDPNTIDVFGRRLLLVEGSGSAVHLAGIDDESGQPAFDDYGIERARKRGFSGDVTALQAPVWSSKTLCGREWIAMAVTDQTLDFDFWREPAVHAPSCRRCLQILDREFPSHDAAPAVAILAELAAEQVVEHGSAEIRGVPGDQVEALRRECRRAIRARGFKSRTWLRDDLVVVWSEDAYEAIPAGIKLERDRRTAEAIGDLVEGKQPQPVVTPWRLRWETWDV